MERFLLSIGILLGARDFRDFQSQAEWNYPSEKDESK